MKSCIIIIGFNIFYLLLTIIMEFYYSKKYTEELIGKCIGYHAEDVHLTNVGRKFIPLFEYEYNNNIYQSKAKKLLPLSKLSKYYQLHFVIYINPDHPEQIYFKDMYSLERFFPLFSLICIAISIIIIIIL